jgi:[glutamine synthetase] adenylyltransferase / [glutamine synthetase]-adenylyl-L-tyrosine phosphorylase
VRRVERPATIDELGPLPPAVAVTLDRLLVDSGASERLAESADLAATTVAVLRASRLLGEVLIAEPARGLDSIASLDDTQLPTLPTPGSADDLVREQRLALLQIAARDLTTRADLVETVRQLSTLAAWVLDNAIHLVDASGLAVVGMGKLGADELNYASDIDLMFVGASSDGTLVRHARGVIELARRCYRVDTALRPEGRDGALVRTVPSYEAYWDRWAEPWEFQALLKARSIAGDPALGGEFDRAAATAVWGRPFGPDELRSVRSLKARSEAATDRRPSGDRDLKLGSGGIRDVEFSVQLLQLVHGHADPALRLRGTLDALAELGRAGYIGRDDAEGLSSAYRFLRRAEHAVQLSDGRQVHALPPDGDELDRIARVLGYRGSADATPGAQLDAERRQMRASVRSIHERLYFRPLLEAFADAPGAITPVVAAARLDAFGFSDANRTRAAVRELTSGLNRASRLMAQMLPLILDWLSTAPDPDQGLLGLRTLVTDRTRGPRITAMFRESPEAARRLCVLLGTSTWLGNTVGHDPELVGRLATIGREPPPTHEELLDAARRAVDWRAEPSERQGGLRRWKDRQVLAVAVGDLLDGASVATTGTRLATIAGATLDAALAAIDPPARLAIIAVGRLGGRELAYHSDLDLLFVHETGVDTSDDDAHRAVSMLIKFVSGATPADKLYDIDPDLRPEGRQGVLSRSIAGYTAYWERWSEPWERLAMVRAHPVAGDLDLGAAWMDALDEHLWGRSTSENDLRAIRMVKARMERERIPAGEDSRFHLKLGRGALADVELTVQLLQLVNGVRGEGTDDALDALTSAGVVSRADAAVMRDAYEFCEQVRSRWHLLRNGPGDSLPSDPDALRRLARSLDTTAAGLRDEFMRVTRRARVVVERLFYGEG